MVQMHKLAMPMLAGCLFFCLCSSRWWPGARWSAPATLAEKVVLSAVSAEASAKYTAPPMEWAWLSLKPELMMETVAPELSIAPPRVAALELNCEFTICRHRQHMSMLLVVHRWADFPSKLATRPCHMARCDGK